MPKNVNIEDIIPKDINIVRCIDNVPIKEIEKIPHAPGVYVLQFADRECYVGSSGNVYHRLKQHKNRLSNFMIGISICETQNILDALILEPIFMKILKPKYNRMLRSDNHSKNQSINTLRKGRDRLKNRSFRCVNTKYMPISEDVLRLLNEKRSELYEQGIFSWSIQTLAEVAIKEGLNTVCDNIYRILEMGKVEKYIDSQRYDC